MIPDVVVTHYNKEHDGLMGYDYLVFVTTPGLHSGCNNGM